MRRSFTPYVLAVVAMIVTLVLLVLATPPPAQNDDPSSRVAGRSGTLALYRWLGALGFNVHRISGHFDTTASDVVLVIDPRIAMTEADAGAVMQSLARGTDVVLAVGPSSAAQARPLLARLRVSLDINRSAGDSVPAQPFDAGDRVHHVSMAAGMAIHPAPYLTPLLAQGGRFTAIAEQVAQAGRAYVLASPFPLSNDGLRDGDSAMLVLAMLERAHGGALGFDEVHHGEMASTTGGAAAVFESPLGLALLLGAVAIVVFLALSGRRLGRPLAAGDASVVPSTATYIDAMAGLYARSRDRGGVAERYAVELKARLAAGIGVDAGVSDDAFIAAVRSVRPEVGDVVAAVLGRARSLASTRPDAAALLGLALEVDDLERRWSEPIASATAQWRQ